MLKDAIERLFRDDVTYPGYTFTVLERGDDLFLQLSYQEPDVDTLEPGLQKTRKWLLSRYATKSEIVQTALKAVLTSHEHRVREHFRYKGELVYGPHFDVDALYELAAGKRLAVRPDPPGVS